MLLSGRKGSAAANGSADAKVARFTAPVALRTAAARGRFLQAQAVGGCCTAHVLPG